MSINPSTGFIPPIACVSRELSNHKTMLHPPKKGDLSACATDAHRTFHFLAFLQVNINTTPASPVEVSLCK